MFKNRLVIALDNREKKFFKRNVCYFAIAAKSLNFLQLLKCFGHICSKLLSF